MNVDFKEMRLPLEVSAWMIGGPMWNTRTKQVQSGDIGRIGLWLYPLHKFEMSAVEREISTAARTKLFHIRARGKLFGFRVFDHFDHTVAAGEGVLLATATPGIYQLAKLYTEDGDSYIRIIKKPIPGTVMVTVGDEPVTVDPVNYKTGLVPLAGTPDPALLAWIGLFDVPMSFTDDWLQIGLNSNGTLLAWNNASVMELRRIDNSFGTPPPLNDFLPAPDGVTLPPGPTEPPPPPPPPATSIVISGPIAGTVAHASRPFAISVDGTIEAPVHVVLNAFPAGGTWSPSSVTVNTALDVQHATYTADTVGNKTLTRTNDGGLANGYNLSFDAFDHPPILNAFPSSLTSAPGSPSPDITVGSNAPLEAATVITPHSSASGGSFVPSTAVIGLGNPDTVTFKRVAAAVGTETITFTNDQGLANPSPVTLSVVEAPTLLSLSPSTMTVAATQRSGEFTATLDKPSISDLTVTLHTTGNGGSFTVGFGFFATSFTIYTGNTSGTFRRTPAAAGVETITLTNDGGIPNGPGATLTVTAAPPPEDFG